MIYCVWKDFSSDTETFTKESFEAMVGDVFEAMKVDEGTDFPSCIWTVNYVVLAKPNATAYNDLSFVKIFRNPVCE